MSGCRRPCIPCLSKTPADRPISFIRFDSESGIQLSQVYGGAETTTDAVAYADCGIELCVPAYRTLREGVSRSALSGSDSAPDSAQIRTGLGVVALRGPRIELCAVRATGRGRAAYRTLRGRIVKLWITLNLDRSDGIRLAAGPVTSPQAEVFGLETTSTDGR